MSDKGKLSLLGGGALVLLAVIILLLLPRREGEISQPGQEDVFILPSYVKLESADTYHGLVDIAGTWVNTLVPSDTITFDANGAYASSYFAANGAFKIEDGYVALTSVANTYEALRMVAGNGIDIFLQRDDDSLPKTYRRVLPGESFGEDTEDAEREEVLRHYLSSVNQILTKSKWRSATDGVDEITMQKNTIRLYTGGQMASEWSYAVLAPTDSEAIPFDPPYVVPIVVDGIEYTLCLDARGDPDYSTGYTLNINNDGAPLLKAESKESVVFEEP